MPTVDEFWGKTHFLIGSGHHVALLFLRVPKKCKDLNLTLLYILTRNMLHNRMDSQNKKLALGVWSCNHAHKIVWTRKFTSALGFYFLQPCSSAGRMFSVYKSRLLLTDCFMCMKKNSMKYLISWIPLKILACRETCNLDKSVNQDFQHFKFYFITPLPSDHSMICIRNRRSRFSGNKKNWDRNMRPYFQRPGTYKQPHGKL